MQNHFKSSPDSYDRWLLTLCRVTPAQLKAALHLKSKAKALLILSPSFFFSCISIQHHSFLPVSLFACYPHPANAHIFITHEGSQWEKEPRGCLDTSTQRKHRELLMNKLCSDLEAFILSSADRRQEDRNSERKQGSGLSAR